MSGGFFSPAKVEQEFAEIWPGSVGWISLGIPGCCMRPPGERLWQSAAKRVGP